MQLGEGEQFEAARDAEFVVDRTEMIAQGVFADVQPLRDQFADYVLPDA